jgi:PREDICTED: similar to AGAP005866-PA
MIPSELERLIKESISKGHQPFYVNCTCGTTVLGAFDPINPLADVCEKYNLWLHIDVSAYIYISNTFITTII